MAKSMKGLGGMGKGNAVYYQSMNTMPRAPKQKGTGTASGYRMSRGRSGY